MMLDHYGELNAVKLTQDDLNQALYNKLAEYPLEMHQQVVDFYSKNKDANKSLFSAALENKIVNDILSKVDLVDKEYNFNDFEKLIESIAEKIK
jgi:FKBP-type peptidyl-prolyl cis-trans isomerase (trigger factor)